MPPVVTKTPTIRNDFSCRFSSVSIFHRTSKIALTFRYPSSNEVNGDSRSIPTLFVFAPPPYVFDVHRAMPAASIPSIYRQFVITVLEAHGNHSSSSYICATVRYTQHTDPLPDRPRVVVTRFNESDRLRAVTVSSATISTFERVCIAVSARHTMSTYTGFQLRRPAMNRLTVWHGLGNPSPLLLLLLSLRRTRQLRASARN